MTRIRSLSATGILLVISGCGCMYDSCRECDLPILVAAVSSATYPTEQRLALGRDTLTLAPLGSQHPLFRFPGPVDLTGSWSLEIGPEQLVDSVYSVTVTQGSEQGLDRDDLIVVIPRQVGTAPLLVQAKSPNPHCGTPGVLLRIVVLECPEIFNGDPACIRRFGSSPNTAIQRPSFGRH